MHKCSNTSSMQINVVQPFGTSVLIAASNGIVMAHDAV